MELTKELIKLDECLIEQDINYEKPYDTQNEALNELKEGYRTGKYFSGLCTKCDKEGNLTININGIDCIMDRNEVSIPISNDNNDSNSEKVHKGLCQKKVGNFIRAKIISISGDEKNNTLQIHVSRKHMIQEIRKYYNEKLKIGSLIQGKVFNIDEKQGVFVDIGGDIIGIIPREYLENLYVINLSDHVSIGDIINAAVLDVQKNSNGDIIHLSLDRKSTLPDFKDLSSNYNNGDIVVAKIKSISSTGVYCSLDKHLDILADFDNKTYRMGQSVRVRIRAIRQDKKRITGVIEGKI